MFSKKIFFPLDETHLKDIHETFKDPFNRCNRAHQSQLEKPFLKGENLGSLLHHFGFSRYLFPLGLVRVDECSLKVASWPTLLSLQDPYVNIHVVILQNFHCGTIELKC